MDIYYGELDAETQSIVFVIVLRFDKCYGCNILHGASGQ